MSRPPLQRVEEVFQEAASLPPAQRSTFLDGRCAGDTALRAAVEDLLRHDQVGDTESFLAGPLAQVRAAPPPPGTLPAIPGYEVLGELGRGGMGIVYLARHTALRRLVALKMLLAGSPAMPEPLARFRAEAEALARLQHPNIVQIYEIGEHEGRPFFAMEYVSGGSLAQAAGKSEDLRWAARLVEELARAIEAVHRCGIVHRDLKPANILLSGEWLVASGEQKADSSLATRHSPLATPKITDFGLARDLAADRHLTRTGQAMGTPAYMSPEQARGDVAAVGPATDIYALGAILYELLSGRPPFEEATAAQTIARVLADEPVSPARLRPGLPRDLVTICLRCLEKEPRKRYVTAQDLADDLHRFLAGEPIRARPVSRMERAWRWCCRRPVVAGLLALSAGLALALVGSVLVYTTRLRDANARLADALGTTERQAEREHRQLVLLHVTAGMRELEAGDSFTAFLWFTEALKLDKGEPAEAVKQRVRIGTMLRQCPHLVQFHAGDTAVLCARLGRRDAGVAAADPANAVRVWDLATGKVRGPALPHPAPVRHAAFRADGRWLATVAQDGTVRVWEIRTGEPCCPPLPQGGQVDRVGFHADGRILLAHRRDSQLRLWDLSARPPALLSGLPKTRLTYSTFSDDGRWAFTLDADRKGRVWDVASRRPAGPPLAVERAASGAAFSPHGRRLALVGDDYAVRVWDVRSGRRLGKPLWHTHPVTHVGWGPAGDRVITASTDHAARLWGVRSARLVVPPLRHTSVVEFAAFSPDGRRLVTGGDDNRGRVWDAATGEAVTPPLLHNGTVNWATFSGDGHRVLTVGMDGSVRLWELTGSCGVTVGPRRVSVPAAGKEARSPDGRRLVRWGKGNTARVIDAATGKPLGRPLRHTSYIQCAAFSPDGRRVATGSDDKTARVWDAATGKLVVGPLLHKGSVSAVAFSPDGRRLLTASEDHTARVWDADTGEPLTPALRHPREVAAVSFSSGGDRAVTVTHDGVARSWDLRPIRGTVERLRLLAGVLAGSRIDDKQRLVPLEAAELRAAWRKLERTR
jgi:WD40 repeat protein